MIEKAIEPTVSKETIQIIGAELKRRRVNQSKTLVNLSSVCSVSYISKIENGKIIPKMHVLRELCDEQGLDSHELNTLLMVDTLIEKSIQHLFWNDKKILDIYNQVYEFDNYKVNFIKIIYEMTYFHWNNVEQLLNSIRIIKDNLNEDDLCLYFYLLMCYENSQHNYPAVYELYNNLKYCKNNYLLALSAKEMFIAVAKFGLDCPVSAYEEYNKRYVSLFNYSNELMYNLLIESLVKANYDLPDSIVKGLKPEIYLQYCLAKNNLEDLDELLKKYSPTPFEKLLIATARKDYPLGERAYVKLQLNKMTATEVIIANYCDLINKGSDNELAMFIIQAATPFAIKMNDVILFKMFLKKLSELSFVVGKYKAVASMNLTYFEMINKCKMCLL